MDEAIHEMRLAIRQAFGTTNGSLDGMDVQRVLEAMRLELGEFAPEFTEYIPLIEPLND